ncbi:MAG: C25 family cysteine peptidase [Candidatus Hodarchaeales archaeon]
MNHTKYILLLVFTLLIGISGLTEGITLKTEDKINQYNFSDIDYLIITSKDFVDTVKPFREWKLEKGLKTEIVTVEEITQRYSGLSISQKIQNCIKETNGIQWVLLAGGSDIVPTPNVYFDDDYPYDGDTVVCDQFYTNLEGDWVYDYSNDWFVKNDPMNWNTSLYIGRLPALTAGQLSTFVSNSINYEKNPPPGDWMTRALMAGAFVCFDEDYDNDSEVDWEDIDGNRYNNWIKNNIIPSNWSTTLLGETTGLFQTSAPYDFPLSQENILQELQKGAGIGIMAGHGSSSSIYRFIFTEDYDNDGLFDYDRPNIYLNGTVDFEAIPLDAGEMIPFLNSSRINDSTSKRGFYFFLACNNGNFDYDFEQQCMASSMLEKYAIGTIASSRVSWAEDFWTERDHPGWYNEGMAGRFFEQIFKYGVTRPGEAFAKAKIDYSNDLKDRGENDPVVLVPKIEQKVLAQLNLLGDPEVPLWLEQPKELDVIIHYSTIEVRDKLTNKPLECVKVTLMNDSYYWSGETFSNGEVFPALSSDELSSLTISVYKEGYLPYIKESEKETESETQNPTTKTSNNIGVLEVLMVVFVVYLASKSKKR